VTTIDLSALLSVTIAILVFFAGAALNRWITPLRRWNIPEAVTGGLLAATVTLIAFRYFGVTINFHLDARDMLLLYFFTGVGLNARLSDLIAGGRPLIVLLLLTLIFLVIQNLVAAGGVAALGLPKGMTPMVGSASLIGGHGTTIAWAPIVKERFGLESALEVGTAAATLGLVLASLIGGPVAGFLIKRFQLHGQDAESLSIGFPHEEDQPQHDDLDHVSLLRTFLILNVAILCGYTLDEFLSDLGVRLPLFVSCLLSGIVLTNVVPRLAPKMLWPTRSRSLALVSDLSLSIFLAMSLMSMQLWTLAGLGLSLVLVLAMQTVVAVIYIIFAVFPAMGRNYDAAVISAGFAGITLGATPTAIANMTAVTKLHGAAPIAFIILPLVSAFFIDIANAFALGFLTN
jgi:ESS family glutamate:Na+ symporter